MISPAGVRAALPHRYPMLLVDRVTEIVPGERLTAYKAVTLNEPWYQRLGPVVDDAELAYPPVLLIESWGQAAGLLAQYDHPEPEALRTNVMVVGGISGAVFHRPVLPGELLEHDVRLVRALTDTMIFEGECRSGGEVVFEVERVTMAYRPAGMLREQPVAH
ncbi:beta-hydroxyacyl-ACP dehydratase [Actinophytocola xinjiangensis]|uniref:Beta-hydroxyacyl-ACP dehydratase n=1 Tax=Actinophytocola xinjiangensis TaxID=485602 RepID=A0A7Z0WK65_9PSEU|nr:beta-hydroxyacyl-ACP dehydratase [Actinophytocola xinjiangensis]